MSIPQSFNRLIVNQISHRIRDVTSLVSVQTPKLAPKEVLVKNKFLGINASDVNFSAGRYAPTVKPPFNVGFEGLGEIVSRGSKVDSLQLHQPVAYMKNGAFSEYMVLHEKEAIPVPSIKKEYLPLLVSGLTAAISLDEIGEIKPGETVLVTAAAGGTGQFAVQLAKHMGCTVIGTCSSQIKVDLLKTLGCDRVVNYKTENLNDVLKNEYPKGIDVVYESVGGEMFDTCVNHLAKHGRLIVIGWISGYQSDKGFNVSRTASSLPQRLLPKSASVRGFFLFNHTSEMKLAASRLIKMVDEGKLKSLVDCGEKSSSGKFMGMDSILDAVDYLYSTKSIGKIVVELPESLTSKL